jgi:hypothetical protein
MVLRTSTHAKTHKYDAHEMLWRVVSAVTPMVLHMTKRLLVIVVGSKLTKRD